MVRGEGNSSFRDQQLSPSSSIRAPSLAANWNDLCEISRAKYDLRSARLPWLNPKAPGAHLYLRTTGLLLTNADLLSLFQADQATLIDELTGKLEEKCFPSEIPVVVRVATEGQTPGEDFL